MIVIDIRCFRILFVPFLPLGNRNEKKTSHRVSLGGPEKALREYEERKRVMRLSAKYRSRKFLRFPKATALQRLQIELHVRGWIAIVGPLAWLDAPDQFPNYVLFSQELGVWLTPSP